MAATQPDTQFDGRYSDATAEATPWAEGRRVLEQAELFWISTVRPDGRPHVTPLIAVWHDGALHVTTGPGERKAMNLAANPAVTITTGCNHYGEGLDVVLEGTAARVTDDATLVALAEAWVAKYGEEWRFEPRDGGFHHDAGEAFVFRVAPTTAFGFAKQPFGQTRWRFAPG